MIAVGDRIEVLARHVAHGGSMLAQITGDAQRSTVFLRHALPGESGTAVVTSVRSGGRLVEADLIAVATPSGDRVAAPCRFSGPGACGGCDFQHVSLPAQRALKAAVVADCLRRIARLDLAEVPWDGTVQAVPGDADGLRWRTRSRFAVQSGALAMNRSRSRDLVPIDDCLIADEEVVSAAREAALRLGGGEVLAVHSSGGDIVAGPAGRLGRELVGERVGEHALRVAADGFWQVHPGAPQVLSAAVAGVLQPSRGEALLDLYAGVGLFAAALAPHLDGGAIQVVEGDRRAAGLAARNLRGIAGCRVHHRPVRQWLAAHQSPAGLVVLDPPRTGAGGDVLREIHRLRPRAVAYVACDPAALARDLRIMCDLGWSIASLRAFDLFPMTHHIECVAGLAPPTGRSGTRAS